MNVPPCPMCGVQYDNWQNLTWHVDNHFQKDNSKWMAGWYCFCDTVFGNSALLQEHLKEEMSSENSLEAHMVLGVLSK